MLQAAGVEVALKIEQVKLNALIPYARNSRTHSDAQVAQIAASIKEFGFTNPVLIDETGSIIAGHGRVMAARKLAITDVPSIRLTHLTEAQKKAYVITDNKLALNAGWDDEMLAVELTDLKDMGFDLDLTGFSTEEIEALLAPAGTEGLTDEDAVPEVPESPVTVLGDVWLMGKHRVMCGDSTSIDAVEKLMDGQKADMVFTDPPYGIGYTPKASASPGRKVTAARKAMVGMLITNDANPADALRVTTDALVIHHAVPAHFVCCDWRSLATITEAMRAAGIEPKACIVWDKGGPYQHLDKFAKGHEMIVYAGPYGGQKTFATDVWKFPREFRDDHPTPKPIELVSYAIEAGSIVGGVVVDVFGGSGSTLIACEKTGRINRSMELDPKYCDVIVQRWQEFTGQTATLEQTGKPFISLKKAA